MKLKFTKMHGAGNDFIVLDLRKKKLSKLKAVMKKLSDRRFGIGFDQALVLKNSRKADFCMEIYNADGSKVEMCGNGIRCFADYIWSRGLSKKKVLNIETMAGIIKPAKAGAGLVRVDMGEPVLEGSRIPTKAKGVVMDKLITAKSASGGKAKPLKFTCVSMGNPHAVTFVKKLSKEFVHEYGPSVETNSFFPNRTNVEFIEVMSKSKIKMRVWERGSGETLACGTGACASVVASHLKGFTGRTVKVILLGGTLKIEWDKKDNHVYMTGPAVETFSGVAEI
ncbi:MAG: diaminopimelate epimerase [Deltaproteobacteria bacterium]|nr:diaminopimelate epimerase [Deltaproteobacteria bacterium]